MAIKAKKGIDLQGQRAVNAADAVANTDLTTLQQVTSLIQGITDLKDPVRAVTTGANITLSGTQTIDGVTLAAGDRVLVKDQTTQSANGIYVVATGAWARSSDANTSAKVTKGLATTVLQGTTKGTGATTSNPVTYVLNATTDPTLDTTPLVFTAIGSAGLVYTAGGGLQLIGQTFSVLLDSNPGLVASGTGLKIDTSVVVRKFAQDCAATQNPQTFNDGFGSDKIVQVYSAAGELVYADVTKGSGTTTVDWGSAPAASDYRVVVWG